MKQPFSLIGKTALVTGGAKGIGEHISKVFASQGANVVLLDTDIENGQKVAAEISNAGNKGRFVECDVTDQEGVHVVIQQISTEFKKIDILINNAGIAQVGKAHTTSREQMSRIIDVNIMGVYNCMHAVIPLMQKNKDGVILNMASVASVLGLEDRFGYSMTKGAVLTMTYSVAKDYVAYGIRCNAIGPGRVHTPFVDGFIAENYPGKEKEMFDKLSATQPIGRMAKPEEVAHMALYLCSDEAAFITGSFYPIDGGFITLNT